MQQANENTAQPVRRTSYGRPLSPTRANILELVEIQPVPTTLAAIVRNCGLHENTVRTHLDELTRDGYLRKTKAEAQGRGRPAWLFSAVTPLEPSPFAGLTSALAEVLYETSDNPTRDAKRAGAKWGKQLQSTLPEIREAVAGVAEAKERVMGVLDGIGFEPTSDARTEEITLNRCPLIEAANKHPEIICNVHLGIIEGAADSMGFTSDGSVLLPFSAPGQCSLNLVLNRAKTGSA
ncbi:transcriptional regulator [Arthrobacter sp. MYb227]|uniref:helix-turn-helix transcriptional regulator n=1 Tax=Arthrobacter sp. MYb227 TaxID=1848601 RepID=UPI000CFDB57D|nr:helix-turn-helix domain-containing protein [Arthrobacter sp. MYb227]PQZ95032.1 transcriptional regulator [Arthrobacter sp. MYb227]